MKVLFVCYGNTCRSPMAAAFFNYMAQQKGLDACAESAGLCVWEGSQASEKAKAVAKRYGVDLSSHRSRQVCTGLVESADLILVMEQAHKKQVEEEFPFAKEKVYTLMEFIGEDGDIYDPMGINSYEAYHQCAKQLWEAVGKVIERLLQEIGQHAK